MADRAVFLDKDGTLLRDVPYNVDPARMELAPGGREALAGVERRLEELFAEAGVPLAGFYYCPHHPEGHVAAYARACSCRKPEPGLIVRAAFEHDLDRRRSWFIGDILNDVEAGRRAGCRTVLVSNGNETEWILTPDRLPHYVAPDLGAAARGIRFLDDPPARRSVLAGQG